MIVASDNEEVVSDKWKLTQFASVKHQRQQLSQTLVTLPLSVIVYNRQQLPAIESSY
jgi:hypothetical protein